MDISAETSGRSEHSDEHRAHELSEDHVRLHEDERRETERMIEEDERGAEESTGK
ncbi:MAG: hypothetical protein J0H43_02480 [Actinobacteria bacterium]|nr:hypothetical protein [Actinomycetota bacterium]